MIGFSWDSSCAAETEKTPKLIMKRNKTKTTTDGDTFFMEHLLSPAGIKFIETVHKVSWLAATYSPRLPNIMRQWLFVDFVPLTVAGQRRTITGFLYWQSYAAKHVNFGRSVTWTLIAALLTT